MLADNTSSSDGTVVTGSTAVTESTAGLDGGWLPVVEGSEGEEEGSAEEELDQEGLPAEIKTDAYTGEAGQLRLIEALRKYDLEDGHVELNGKGKAHWGTDWKGLPVEIKRDTYIGEAGEVRLMEALQKYDLEDGDVELDGKGKARWRKIPTHMHQKAIFVMENRIRKSQSETIFINGGGNINVGKKGVKKVPDVAIWGKERLDDEETPISVEVDGALDLGFPSMNPHVIIEFSWTHDLEEKEIPKFNRQMQHHVGELGEIKLGFHIKTKPSFGTKLAPEKSPGDIPVCGFDVFKAVTGEHVIASRPFLQYRIGVNEDAAITIPGGYLGEGEYSDVVIPLQAIANAIKKVGVKFERKVRVGLTRRFGEVL